MRVWASAWLVRQQGIVSEGGRAHPRQPADHMDRVGPCAEIETDVLPDDHQAGRAIERAGVAVECSAVDHQNDLVAHLAERKNWIPMQVRKPTIGGIENKDDHVVIGPKRGIALQTILRERRCFADGLEHAWRHGDRHVRGRAFQPASEGPARAPRFLQHDSSKGCAGRASVEKDAAYPASWFAGACSDQACRLASPAPT